MYLRTTWNGMTNASRSCFPTFLVNQEPEAARASPSEHCPAQGLLLFYCISSIQPRFPRIQPHPAPAPLESCENRKSKRGQFQFSFPPSPETPSLSSWAESSRETFLHPYNSLQARSPQTRALPTLQRSKRRSFGMDKPMTSGSAFLFVLLTQLPWKQALPYPRGSCRWRSEPTTRSS